MKLLSFLFFLGVTSSSLNAQVFDFRAEDPIPSEVDAIYERGLNYLAKSQTVSGNWPDQYGGNPGVVGLCLMSFLAKGDDPKFGPYAINVERCLNYILTQQNENNGYIGSSMYNHGFATLALAEAYGTVDDPRIAPALKKAVSLILSAQEANTRGAWRYTPESTDADTTVSGCQIVALYAARNSGIPVPEANLKKALRYMKSCRSSDGGYGYVSAGGGRPTLTAIGSLCFSLAKEKDNDGFKSTVNYLKEQMDYRDEHYPFYFEYYMSQALFQADVELWQAWNKKNIRLLAVTQNREGFWSSGKGSSFSTAGALLSLALNYRFLPIYER